LSSAANRNHEVCFHCAVAFTRRQHHELASNSKDRNTLLMTVTKVLDEGGTTRPAFKTGLLATHDPFRIQPTTTFIGLFVNLSLYNN